MPFTMEHYKETAEFLKEKLPFIPDTVVVLGSGLGAFAEEINHNIKIDYHDIPHFPSSTVSSHKGVLHCGTIGRKQVLALQGRFHYYEGYSMEQTAYWVRALKLLGVKNAVITNAAGAINESFKVGDIMLIRDHIKLCAESPTTGKHNRQFGERFFDMTEAYSHEQALIAKECAKRLGISLKEGVYAYMTGPQFETPAEIRALRIMGADAVGMSTVPEVIACAQSGIKVIGLSCLTNMAAGITSKPLSDKDVEEASAAASETLFSLIKEIAVSL